MTFDQIGDAQMLVLAIITAALLPVLTFVASAIMREIDLRERDDLDKKIGDGLASSRGERSRLISAPRREDSFRP